MTYYDELKKGYIVLPQALMEHFSQLFPSSEDFLVWLYFYENAETAPSEIAKKTGRQLSEVNQSITALQNFGALKMTLIEVNGDVESIFDISPAFKHLDELESQSKHFTNTNPEEVQDDGRLKHLAETFEAELGVISPMQMEELRSLLFEDNYDLELIKLALKEAVLNRKANLKYIKAILRNWKNEGITSVQAAESKKQEYQESKQTPPRNDLYIPMDGPWN